MQEYAIGINSQEGDDHMPPNLLLWQSELRRASLLFGKKMTIVESLKQSVIDTGFEEVKEDIYKVSSVSSGPE